MVSFIKKFVRDPSEKAVTKIIRDLVPQFNALEPGMRLTMTSREPAQL